MKRALITGVTGQDGSYLADFLLSRGYEVHGLIRRSSNINRQRIDHITSDDSVYRKRFFLHYGDVTDALSITELVGKIYPYEIYHLAANSHVGISFDIPDYTAQVNALGTIRLLGAIKNINREIKLYNAATSELFGKTSKIPQNESTPFYPRSPYAAAKLYSFWITVNYREAYEIYACNGILHNHESIRRSENFVTRKITRSVGRIKNGMQDCLYLGNLSAKRDWGYAPEYVESMVMMLQQKAPDDYVIATGETHTVEEFCSKAFDYANIPIHFEGKDINRVGRLDNGKIAVSIDPRFFRPTEVDFLVGDASKAKRMLGWEPKVTFNQLVKIMTEHDIKLAEKEKQTSRIF